MTDLPAGTLIQCDDTLALCAGCRGLTLAGTKPSAPNGVHVTKCHKYAIERMFCNFFKWHKVEDKPAQTGKPMLPPGFAAAVRATYGFTVAELQKFADSYNRKDKGQEPTDERTCEMAGTVTEFTLWKRARFEDDKEVEREEMLLPGSDDALPRLQGNLDASAVLLELMSKDETREIITDAGGYKQVEVKVRPF